MLILPPVIIGSLENEIHIKSYQVLIIQGFTI